MEFRDLKQQYQLHKQELDSAIQSVLTNADFIQGKKVLQLEKALAEYVGVRHCITCANGTDALQLALMTWNIGRDDVVFVPDFTFFSSGEVVPLVGATPVFVDIDEKTYNMNPQSLEKAIEYIIHYTNLNPRVIVAVDLFGQPADFEQLSLIAKKYDPLILEDAAQGFGGRIQQKRACSFGDISTTSFFPAKPLGCYGDGGAIFTNNDDWAELLRSYCIHGRGKDKYDNVRIGINSRLDTLQAAILYEKLKFFDAEISRCTMVAEIYTKLLKDAVKVPLIKSDIYSSWAQYTICFHDSEERERVMQRMEKDKIPFAIYYRNPMHKQKAFIKYKMPELDYKISKRICQCCLSLPMHPYLEIDDIQFIVDRIV